MNNLLRYQPYHVIMLICHRCPWKRQNMPPTGHIMPPTGVIICTRVKLCCQYVIYHVYNHFVPCFRTLGYLLKKLQPNVPFPAVVKYGPFHVILLICHPCPRERENMPPTCHIMRPRDTLCSPRVALCRQRAVGPRAA